MKNYIDLFYLIGMITVILSFILYFVFTSKKKVTKEKLPSTPKHVNQYTVKYIRICGYWFYCTKEKAIEKLRLLVARKGLQLFNKGGQTFIYLNRTNMIRKMNRLNLENYINAKLSHDSGG